MSIEKNKKLKKILKLFIFSLLLSFILILIYVANNYIFISEKAAVYSLKPIKHSVKSSEIFENICYDNFDCSINYMTVFKQQDTNLQKKPAMIILASNFWHNSSINHYFHLAGLAYRSGFNVFMVNLPQGYGPIKRFFFTEDNKKKNLIDSQIKMAESALLFIEKELDKYGSNSEIHILAVEAAGQIFNSVISFPYNNISTLKKKIKSVVMINPILHLYKSEDSIYSRYIEIIFEGDLKKMAMHSVLQNINIFEQELKIPVLILKPEKNYEVFSYGFSLLEEKLSKNKNLQNFINIFEAKEKSAKTMVYKLGRKDDSSTQRLNYFWKNKKIKSIILCKVTKGKNSIKFK